MNEKVAAIVLSARLSISMAPSKEVVANENANDQVTSETRVRAIDRPRSAGILPFTTHAGRRQLGRKSTSIAIERPTLCSPK
jgi:hypothetical protein